ncbi:MAG: hypothetical protein JWM05_319 [Acidimicrobiales bacterium]|nr:hypothetical protein [Acidimicrobiales bacterium]
MPGPREVAGPSRRWWARPERWLALVACGLAGFSFAAVALLTVDLFHPALVLPLALVLAGLLAWAWGDWAPVPAERAERTEPTDPWWFWAIAVVIVLGSVGVNAARANEHTTLNRDPGTYFNAALVLRDHADPTYRPAGGGFAGRSDLGQGGPGLQGTAGGRIGFQGLHLLPAFGALGGWVGGDNGLARVPAVLGGLFLLFLMAFARRLVGPVWALLAGCTFALLLPFGYGARDFLSEMVLGPALFAALWLLTEVFDGDGPRRALLPGALLGMAAMSRIDSPLALIGLLGFVGMWLVASRGRGRTALALIGPLAAGVVLAAADGWVNARSYFGAHRAELLGEAAFLAALAVGVALWWILSRRWLGRIQAWWTPRRRMRAATGLVALTVIVVLLALFVRPLVQEAHTLGERAALIEGFQRGEGLEIDGTRSYDEYSAHWLSWYLGPIGFGAAVAGGAWLMHRLVRGRARRPETLLLSVLAPPLVLYLYRPSIFPDQLWATRRYLPVIFPMLVVLEAWCAAQLWATQGRWARHGRAAAVVLAAASLAFPAAVLVPIWRFRVYNDHLGQVRQVCGLLPPDAAVVTIVDPSQVSTRAIGTVCKVPAAAYLPNGGEPSRHVLDEIAAAWRRDGRRLWLVSLRTDALADLGIAHPAVTERVETTALRSALRHRPYTLVTQTQVMAVAPY